MEDKKFEKMRFKGKLKIDYLNLRCIYFHLLEEKHRYSASYFSSQILSTL